MDRWDHLQPHLRQRLGDEEYGTWIAPLAVLENTDEQPALPYLGPDSRDEFLALLP